MLLSFYRQQSELVDENERKGPAVPATSGELADQGSGIAAALRLYYVRTFIVRAMLARNMFALFDQSLDKEEPATLAGLRRVAATMKAFAREKNAKLMFVYLPSASRYLNPGKPMRALSLRADVLDIAREAADHVVDISADFDARRREDAISLYALPSNASHFNPAGYLLVAERIAEALESSAPITRY